MAATPTALYRDRLPAGAIGTIYTAPASPAYVIIKQIVLQNLSASAVSCEIRLGATAYLYNRSISSGETVVLDLAQVLPGGQVIAAAAATSSTVSCHISGLVVT